MGTIALVWIVLAVCVGIAATSRGRSGAGWFVLACILSPVIALLLLIAMQPRNGVSGAGVGASWLERYEGRGGKQCPYCRSIVHRAATVCPACTREIDTVEAINQREVATAGARRTRSYGGAALILIAILAGLYFSKNEPATGDHGAAAIQFDAPTAGDGGTDEIYRYACDAPSGPRSTVIVNASRNKLDWQGRSYDISQAEDCGRFGWRAERGGVSFKFCTATKGYADFEQNGTQYQCQMERDADSEPKGD